MQAVILAAGSGKRMRPLTVDTPKSLLRVGGQSFLGRLLHQLNEYDDLSRVVLVVGHNADRVAAAATGYEVPIEIVRNDAFATDTNIGSMHLALQHIDPTEPLIVIEADVFVDDLAMRQIVEAARRDTSTWFTRGAFDPSMAGGVLHHDADGRVDDIRIVDAWSPDLAHYRKLLGVMTIAAQHVGPYAAAVAEARESTTRQYYLMPWIANLSRFDTRVGDLQECHTDSVNTAADYEELVGGLRRRTEATPRPVELVPVEWLRPIEAVRPDRVAELAERIESEAIWHRALVVEREHLLVLDGHHRLQVALQRGLRHVPAVLVDYDEVPVWSLRPDQEVSRELVIQRATAGDLYPNKTAKHQFPALDLACRYVLTRLAA
jgi:CTP:phosphocholine cytidylyltransferase-like protein